MIIWFFPGSNINIFHERHHSSLFEYRWPLSLLAHHFKFVGMNEIYGVLQQTYWMGSS